MDRFLEDLKDKIDLVQLIGKYATVKKQGRNYVCKSPFRKERTPSFSINPEKGVWYDFGASEGGDAIRFIEKIENISFKEAIEVLAESVNLKVPKKTKKFNPEDQKKQNRLAEIYTISAEFFQKELQKSPTIQTYLKNRGITEQTITEWKIGYGGTQKDGLSRYLVGKGFSPKEIESAGLSFYSYSSNTLSDFFWGRVLTPIFEPKEGQIIAFSGRILNPNGNIGAKPKAKYLNSPEHLLYKKQKTLFGLWQAKKSIKKQDFVVLVEGNFDVITAHQKNINQTVATCGTSLTEDHLRVLKRMTKRLYLAFDNDLAGKKAMLRSTQMILEQEMEPFFILFPENIKDIDEHLQKNEEIPEPKPALEYLLSAFAKKFPIETLNGQKKLLDAFFPFLRLVFRPLELDFLLEQTAKYLKKPKTIIESEFRRYKSQTPTPKPKFIKESKKENFTAQQRLAGFISQNWEETQHFITTSFLELISEPEPKKLIQKKKENTLNQEEIVRLTAFEMMIGETRVTKEVIQETIKNWVKNQQEIQEKQKNQQQMLEKLKKRLGN